MPQATTYAMIMLAAGIGIPILAALNAALGQHIGSALAAGVVIFVVGFLISLTVVILSGDLPHLAQITTAPKHLFLAGGFMAFYAITITFVAPKFGIGNAVFFVLLGQLISAAIIDQFGLFGAQISPLSLTRAAGIAVMAAGVWLTQIA
ncbi:DMT family transporter [Cognatishimia sp. WU-CL00825]|uniref:DMT family transporter n=1 Tax=Cognatishimia sp. WU-CL00825 TaxID=3127658 RepID=UPI0031085D70